MNKETFRAKALEYREWYYNGQRSWSVAHHSALFGSILCSITAGALLQFSQPDSSATPNAPEARVTGLPISQPTSPTNSPNNESQVSPGANPTGSVRSRPLSIAAILTSVAAALTGIASSGGFERKWRSNRISRSRIDVLLLDVEADNPNLADLESQLKDIIGKHDSEIVAKA